MQIADAIGDDEPSDDNEGSRTMNESNRFQLDASFSIRNAKRKTTEKLQPYVTEDADRNMLDDDGF